MPPLKLLSHSQNPRPVDPVLLLLLEFRACVAAAAAGKEASAAMNIQVLPPLQKSQAVAPLCRQAAQQLAAYSITLDVPIIPSRPSVSPFENGNRKKKSRKSNPSALERYPARPGPGPYQSAVIPKLELFLSCRAGRPVQPNGTGAERFEKREEWQLAILALHPSPIEITHVGCCCCCWERLRNLVMPLAASGE